MAFLELLALHHAHLLARSGAAAEADVAASGRAGASATFLSMRVSAVAVLRQAMRVCRCLLPAACTAALSGPGAFGRSTSSGAAASGASQRGLSAGLSATLRHSRIRLHWPATTPLPRPIPPNGRAGLRDEALCQWEGPSSWPDPLSLCS
jgi:hypothetical protein